MAIIEFDGMSPVDRQQKGLLDAASHAVIITRNDNTITYWNKAAETVYGWSAYEVLGRAINEVLPSEVVGGQKAVANVETGGGWAGEVRIRRKSGEAIPAFVSLSPLKDETGEPAGVMGLSFEMSGRAAGSPTQTSSRPNDAITKTPRDKRTNRRLMHVRGLLAELGLAVFLFAIATALRWGLGQISSGILPYAVYFPAAAIAGLVGGWRSGFAVSVLGGLIGGLLFVHDLPSEGRSGLGAVVNLLLFAVTMALVVAGAVYQRDLARQLEQSNKALSRRDLYYRALFDRMTEGFALCDGIFDQDGALVDYYILEINPALQAMLGVGPDVIGGKFSSTPGSHRRWLRLCDSVIKTGRPAAFESHNRQTNLWHEVHITRVGETQMAQFFFDITARKHAEQRQKELFAEMSHRVRNNLTQVSSLLTLQARGVAPEIRDQLLKAAARMHSIAEVHSALYRGAGYEHVQFDTYVADLCDSISKALLNDERVVIAVRAEPVSVSVDMAITLGMAVTEMVTNAVKYAYPSPMVGDILVTVERRDRDLRLSVSDRGVGFKQTPERSAGLGMRLIDSFAKQLNGELTVSDDAGATVEIRAPLPGDAVAS
jgi:PAS domain S-box-containing protein